MIKRSGVCINQKKLKKIFVFPSRGNWKMKKNAKICPCMSTKLESISWPSPLKFLEVQPEGVKQLGKEWKKFSWLAIKFNRKVGGTAHYQIFAHSNWPTQQNQLGTHFYLITVIRKKLSLESLRNGLEINYIRSYKRTRDVHTGSRIQICPSWIPDPWSGPRDLTSRIPDPHQSI